MSQLQITGSKPHVKILKLFYLKTVLEKSHLNSLRQNMRLWGVNEELD